MVESYSSYRSCSYSNNPSFSSTLLDAIYRSIDQGEEGVGVYGERIMREKQVYSSDGVAGGAAAANVPGVFRSEEEEMANLQRACMIEKWMEKKVGGERNAAVRRKSAADLQTKKSRKHRGNSSSSSSDSSCCGGGGGSFFSETETFPVHRPKPIRTGNEKERLSGGDYESNRRERRSYGGEEFERKPKHESGFLKTKSRALKIYGDLKKVKQPISPGGKLAGFLNSLFTGGGGNPKKSKVSTAESPSLKSANASTCSSASSFSRSCLSKTPSSQGKSSNGAKRSVRFSPVSVIVDEDCQPCGQKSLHTNKKENSNFEPAKNNNNNNINSIKNVINDQEELMIHVMEKNRHVEQVARDLLRNYQRKNQVGCEFEFSIDNLRKSHNETKIFDQNFVREDEDEDEDDAASYASSDLFELDNLSSIGMERYIEELPVYETTHFGTNRALANGLIL